MRLFGLAAAVVARFVGVSAIAEETPSPRDPEIEKMVAEISPARIEATLRRRVAFKTRHALSSTTSAESGIGAASNGIKAEFERASAESGGRRIVAFDAFHQPPQPPRLPAGAAAGIGYEHLRELAKS